VASAVAARDVADDDDVLNDEASFTLQLTASQRTERS